MDRKDSLAITVSFGGGSVSKPRYGNKMDMKDIIGIEIDYSQLPADYNSSMHPEAVKYRRALARASNAIEGVILSAADKAFMDSIPLGMPKDEFKQAVLNHIYAKRKAG